MIKIYSFLFWYQKGTANVKLDALNKNHIIESIANIENDRK